MDAMGNQERESNGSGQNLKKYLTICDFYETKNALWFGNKVKVVENVHQITHT